MESGFQIKNKWDKEEELSEVINFSIEFENNLNKIDEMNENINKCNSSKTKISFKINKEKIEEDIAELGFIVLNDEKDEENEREKQVEKSDKESEASNDSKKSERSKSSRKSSISSKRSKKSISDDED